MIARRLKIILGLMTLTLLYQNCGSEFRTNGQDILASSLSCAPTMGLFKSTFYPFVAQNCVSCHTSSGPGKGAFASADASVAFNAFILMDKTNSGAKIASYATNAGHASPYTGPQNNAAVTPILTTWNAATTCGASGIAGQIATSQKQMNLTTAGPYGSASEKVMSWDLSNEVNGVSSTGTLQIKVYVEQHALNATSVNYNYFFLNPTIIGNTSNIHVKAMQIYINGHLADTVTAYNNANVILPLNNTKGAISPIGQQFAMVLPAVILPTDTISLYFDVFSDTVDAPNAPLAGPPLAP
jgi:hypothetical protein